MSMTTGEARVVDPILTEFAQGYKNTNRVGHFLFPAVPVKSRGGKVLEFGKEDFQTLNARRAPGSDTHMVEFGYEGKPFQLVQDALNSPIPREIIDEAAGIPDIDLGKRATKKVMNVLTLGLEVEQAELATNSDNYDDDNILDLAENQKWNNPESDPLDMVESAKDRVMQISGVEPNRLVLSKKGFRALKFHPKIVERFKYTTSESITEKMLANLFDLEMIAVSKASVMNKESKTLENVWGNSAVLAYVPNEALGQEEPSYGYTYTLEGHPFVESPWWDNNKKSWVYGVTYERIPVLTGISSGFLFENLID